MKLKTSQKVSFLLLTLFSICVMALLAACGPVQVSSGNTTITLPTSSTSPQAAVATLKHSPLGTTDLSWDPKTEKLTVKISLTGLAPKSAHAAHIHAGTCAVDGAIVYPLNAVVADAKGDATSETTIEHVRNGIPAQGWYVNVHNGQGTAQIEHMPITCGNISNSNISKVDVQSVHVTMQGTTAPNENATGKAELTLVNGKPALKITLAGLQPGSTHAAHIHAGGCEAQGPVLVMLNPVVADAQGNGTSVTPLDHLPFSSNGLYVNVHEGATMAELSQSVFFDPIACGNVFPG